MAAPITDAERRQLYIIMTVVMSLVTVFWCAAVVSGHARWPDLLLPLAVLSLSVRGLVRVTHPIAARWLLRVAVPLVAGGALYAIVQVSRTYAEPTTRPPGARVLRDSSRHA